MRALTFLIVLTIFGVSGGCARKPDVTYVELPPEAPPVSSSARGEVSNGRVQLASSIPIEPEPERESSAPVVSDVVEEPVVQFDLVQAKAEQVGVEHLTQSDIEGLSFAEIQKLRGY